MMSVRKRIEDLRQRAIGDVRDLRATDAVQAQQISDLKRRISELEAKQS